MSLAVIETGVEGALLATATTPTTGPILWYGVLALAVGHFWISYGHIYETVVTASRPSFICQQQNRFEPSPNCVLNNVTIPCHQISNSDECQEKYRVGWIFGWQGAIVVYYGSKLYLHHRLMGAVLEDDTEMISTWLKINIMLTIFSYVPLVAEPEMMTALGSRDQLMTETMFEFLSYGVILLYESDLRRDKQIH